MLRLSIYLNLSFEHRNDLTKDQYSYGFDFFNQLVGIEVEKPYNNNLFNGIRDLTIEDKNYILNTPEGKKQCATFVLNWLIPSLQVLTIDDYYSKLKSVIENDETISLKTKEGLLKPLNDGKKEQFLCKTLLYAINKDNIDVRDKIPPEDMEFVFESNKRCSKCGCSLIVKKNKKSAFKYGIVSIFPEGLDETKKADFLSIAGKEPTDYSNRSNKICCCSTCADDYECMPTTDTFIILRDKKKFYNDKDNANSTLEKAKLDEELQEILLNLRNIRKFSEIADFRKKPLELKEKIDENEPLRLTIKNDVESYYNYTRKMLSDLDDAGDEFTVIASQFQICYKKLVKVMDDQEEIYNRIIKWVLDELKLTDKYATAARIIVSFFVQNCEVFDEISK